MTTSKKKAKAAPAADSGNGPSESKTPPARDAKPDAPQPNKPAPAPAKKTAPSAPSSDSGGGPSAGTEPAGAPAPSDGGGERRGSGGALAAVALVIALAAAGAAGFLWYQDRTVQSPRLSELAQKTDGLAARAEQAAKQAQSANADAASNSSMLTQMRERQSALEEQVRRFSQEQGRSRDEVALEEVRQLLLQANHRVRLAGDIDTAVAALKVADSRLEAMADPDLLEVRSRVNEEIAALQATPRPDITGLVLRLRGLANNVDALPLVTTTTVPEADAAQAEAAPPPDAGRARLILREIWHSLRKLVSFRRLSEPLPPLLPPEQEFFLRENLRLALRGAELAALQGREEVYRAQLDDASAWVRRYFDTDKEVVQMELNELGSLRESPLSASLPDIGASLQALEKITQSGSN
jgi:uncharacterized protein HemX